MRARLFLLLFAFVFMVRPAAAMDIERVVSPGGIEAWLVEEHAVPLIAVQVGFRGGAAFDPKGREGLATMLSALLDQGAGPLDARAFQERLAATAINLDFATDRDAFYASLGMLTTHRDEAFSLLNKALTAPRFDDAPVARVRAQLEARLERESEDPESVAAKRWFAEAFPNHVYGRPTHGTKDSVAAISVADLKALAARIFVRDRLYVAVVGDIDAKTLKRLLDKTFGALGATSGPDDIPDVTPAPGHGIIVVHKENPQSVAIFGGKGLKRDDPDFYAAYVLNHIMGGGGFTARLTHEIREKRGLAYSVETSLVPYDHAGLMIGSLGTENGHVKDSLALVREAFKHLLKKGVTAEELKDAKTYLTGSYPLRFSGDSRIASELVGIQLEHLGIDYVNKRNGLIEAVTLDDLKRVAPRIFDTDGLITVVVGDPKGL